MLPGLAGRRRIMTPRLFIFDFDGVIVDSLEVFEACVRAACRECGGPPMRTRADFLKLFEANMYDGLRAAGVAPDGIPRLMNILGPKLEAQAGRCALVPGMAGVLARLAEVGRVAVVTSNLTAVVASIFARCAVTGVGEVLGADRGTGKVEKINRLRREMPGAPCYYVGDTSGDIREGRAAGAATVAVTWGWHSVAALAAANPDYTVNSPRELLALLSPPR